jgi:membrane-associated protease RseP (regulator of RpoE activity)
MEKVKPLTRHRNGDSMFGLSDLLSLVISAFIILPVVIFLRELGYLIVSAVFGVENPRLTIGSGPRLFKFAIFDVRKYYHLYSWYSYDSLKRKSNFAYVSIYAAPILTNLVVALVLNALLANGTIQEYKTFWDRFIFYAFYYVLFDLVPMKTVNGMPNNGLIIYEMLRYGRRTDYNQQPFIPATSDVEEQYEEEMERIEEIKEKQKEEESSAT